MFPNRVPTDRDTPSPEPLAKRGDSIRSCMPESPKRGPPTYTQEKHKVTVHGAPRWTEGLHTMGRGLVPQGDR
jgi:hypothetical protein